MRLDFTWQVDEEHRDVGEPAQHGREDGREAAHHNGHTAQHLQEREEEAKLEGPAQAVRGDPQ